MTGKRGFSLIEILVVIVIIGVLTAITLPFYFTYIVQGEAKTANNNLLTIYGAQNNHYLSDKSYCTANCDNTADINSGNGLSLDLADSYFTYACHASAPQNPVHTIGFTCTATHNEYSTFILTLQTPRSCPILTRAVLTRQSLLLPWLKINGNHQYIVELPPSVELPPIMS